MQNERIIALLQKDPERGMERLMEQYTGLVCAVIRSRLLIPPFAEADIEDCAADTFLEFYQGLERFSPAKGSVKGWLCAIAARNALDRVRRAYAAPQMLPLEEGASLPSPDPGEEILAREERRRLLDAVLALGQPDREIIVRKFYLGQPSKEIAERLGMTASNVDVRTHRAIEKLRNVLEVHP